jgi:asparagine N-glycosylation enzyme membrane subunit Stt3
MEFLNNIGKYNKFITALLTAVSVGVTTFAHTAAWAPTVLAAIGAITVYLVPNSTVAAPSASDK